MQRREGRSQGSGASGVTGSGEASARLRRGCAAATSPQGLSGRSRCRSGREIVFGDTLGPRRLVKGVM